ncbi:dual specificity protein phosphatase DSP8 [Canna indica]|uniref:phosphatidylglycerophosphatase n=1 Tax=Canna indica TaxID=4628 RepID=A0AAQ3L4Z2_9LILI|nr:dual specificity protein phosphatase DSP8 [Canna indica]
MRIAELEDPREEDPCGGDVAKTKAKKALVGAGARILFYPTLMYNVIRNKVEAEFHWWDEVDQFLLLGAVPFPNDVPRLQQLGVRGVITLNEPYETLVSSSLYKVHGMDHLVIPTRDYLFAPSVAHICQAVDFIHRNASCGRTTYVHCKAGRGRSTTIVLCYLVEYKNMTPVAALDYVRTRRPRILLAPSQWRAVQEYSQHKLDFPAIKSTSSNYLLAGDEVFVSETDLEGYTIVKRSEEASLGGDEVLVTEADLEGYETFTSACKERNLPVNEDARMGTAIRWFSCLCTSMKLSATTQFQEIHAF